MWSHLLINSDRKALLARRTNAKELSTELGKLVFGAKPGIFACKALIVGEDIDITNFKDVTWAEVSRCEPGKNEYEFPGQYPSIKVIPYVSRRDEADKSLPGKVVRCCLLPQEFTDEKIHWKECSFKGQFPEDVQRKVLENWTEYGF